MSFMLPAKQAMIPKMVGPDRMSNAMALNAGGLSVTSLFGPAAAGFLYAVLGPDGVFYISCALGVSAIVSTTQIRPSRAGAASDISRLLSEIVDGLRYVSRRGVLQGALALMLATTLFVHTTIFLLPVIVVDVYHRTSDAYGVLISMEGLGALAGAVVLAAVTLRRSGMVLIVSCTVSGIMLLLISRVTDYYVAIAFMVALGVAETGRRVLCQGILLSESDDEYRGRTMSLYTMVVGLMPLGVLPAGAAMDWLGGQVTLFILGALMVGSCGLILATQRELRALP
jgi:predicted MFS family arabinose efflux permease